MNPLHRNLAIGVLIALVAGAALYSFTKSTPPQDGTTGAIITEVPLSDEGSGIPAPNYAAPLKFNASVSAEVRSALQAQLDETIRQLNANSDNFALWLNLGILRKMAGDYRGAEEIWLYTSKNWPTGPTSFNNLGDLYQNFLNEPAKAQAAYAEAARLQAQADQ